MLRWCSCNLNQSAIWMISCLCISGIFKALDRIVKGTSIYDGIKWIAPYQAAFPWPEPCCAQCNLDRNVDVLSFGHLELKIDSRLCLCFSSDGKPTMASYDAQSCPCRQALPGRFRCRKVMLRQHTRVPWFLMSTLDMTSLGCLLWLQGCHNNSSLVPKTQSSGCWLMALQLGGNARTHTHAACMHTYIQTASQPGRQGGRQTDRHTVTHVYIYIIIYIYIYTYIFMYIYIHI